MLMDKAVKFTAPLMLGAMVMASVATVDVASAATFNPALTTTTHSADVTPVWWRGGWGWHRGYGWRGYGWRGYGWRGYGWRGGRWCYWHPRACW